MKSSEIAVLVVSCDKYSDLWQPFFECFRRYWPDCPYQVYLLSNYEEAGIQGLEVIKTGEDKSWSENMIKALQQIEHRYIFMFLEDLFLYKPVNNNRVVDLFQWALENDVNYLRMALRRHRADKIYNDKVGIINKGSIYRASTVMALWKKNVLLNLLEPGESAWQFEIEGTVRADRYDKFYATWSNYFYTINTVFRGKWVPSALRKVKRRGIDPDLQQREVMNCGDCLKLKLLEFRSFLLTLIPVRFRRKIRKRFIKKPFI